MRIGVIGAGYVGLVTATCLADSGNHVTAIDKDSDKVRRLSDGEPTIFEPGLAELLRANLRAGRLRFSTSMADLTRSHEATFLAVGTPPRPDGSADLTNLHNATRELASVLNGSTVVIVKSTVPPGTGDALEKLLAAAGRTDAVVSNPEFLREGDAVNNFLRPDRVVIGAEDPAAGDLVEELYRPFVRNNKPILRMSRAAAELTKYAANAYLAMRVSFINEIAEICELRGIDVNEVRRGIGTDDRIGQHFLYPGIGYGGSCFPKDVQALVASTRAAGGKCDLLAAIHTRNVWQRAHMLARIRNRLSQKTGARVAVWGLAFKPKTDDIREAPALDLIQGLLASGIQVSAYDPQATANARAILGDRVDFASGAYEALHQADALAICTEWNEFRSPDFVRMRESLRTPLIFDGRNLYEPATLRRYGFEYWSVGRPTVYADGP